MAKVDAKIEVDDDDDDQPVPLHEFMDVIPPGWDVDDGLRIDEYVAGREKQNDGGHSTPAAGQK